MDPVSIVSATLAMGGSVGTGAAIASTLGTIGTIVSGVSTIGSIFSGMGQNAAEEEAAIAQQQAAANAAAFNAEIARKNAAIEESKTQAELEKADREKRLRLGGNIASAGASGMSFSGSSLIDILSDNAAQEELNIGTIKQQGFLAKQNYLQQAGLYNASAANAAGQISGIKKAGKYKTASSILKSTPDILSGVTRLMS